MEEGRRLQFGEKQWLQLEEKLRVEEKQGLQFEEMLRFGEKQRLQFEKMVMLRPVESRRLEARGVEANGGMTGEEFGAAGGVGWGAIDEGG